MGLVGRVKSLCANKGITLSKLEKELKFGNGTIRNWDANYPSVDKVQKVAAYFKVSTDYLLLGFEWRRLVDFIGIICNGRSHEQFAKDTGVDLNELSVLCMGIFEERPSLETLKKIAANNPVRYIASNADLFKAAGYPEQAEVEQNYNGVLETYPVGKMVKVPIIGTVTAGPNGLAYEDYQGLETVEADYVKGGNYFYLRIKGDSMIGDGILPGDLALVRETPEVEYGTLAIVIIEGQEGTLKRVYQNGDNIILQSSNPKCPPRIFKNKDMEKVRIVGQVKSTIRNY